MVNLVRPQLVEQLGEPHRVRQVAVVQEETHPHDVRILVQMVDALRVEIRRPPDETVDFVALRKQQLRQIGAVLARDARDQRLFHARKSPFRS
jgi:hypothetical protein